jgi:hypothetical protein
MFASLDTVNPSTLKDVMLILLALLAAAVGIRALFPRKVVNQISPDPLRVQGVERYLEKREFDDFKKWNDGEHSKIFHKIGGVERGAGEKMDAKFSELQRSAEEGREKIHKRLNRISVGLAVICGRMGAEMPREEEES